MACKSVMYHYVRPSDASQPHLYYLNLDDFERQLDFFDKEFGFVTHDQWVTALDNPDQLPEGMVLTFDDGLSDHYNHVYPVLKARGIWGIFYVSSATLNALALLNVHRVHYLLGRFGGGKVLTELECLLDDSLFLEGFYEQLKGVPYAKQSMDEHSLRVKKIVNYALKPECKDKVLSALFKQLVGDERIVARQLYMTPDQIAEMSRVGFQFGAHGNSHNLLTKFSGEELVSEVEGSVDKLNTILEFQSDTFCYPYGGPDSWNDEVLSGLKSRSIRYGFCVESDDIKPSDLRTRPLCLPRYDCNEFLYGKSRISK